MGQTQQPEKNLHELVVYHLVHRGFELSNIYAMGGWRPNAKYIASQYGCQLEFRISQFRNHPNEFLNKGYFGIAENGECLSAVLVGENREDLVKAARDIHLIHGVTPFNEGTIKISDKRTIFSQI